MINNSMKSFKEYLAEAVQENPIRIKIACDVTDDMMNIIERELERYDIVSINLSIISSFKLKKSDQEYI